MDNEMRLDGSVDFLRQAFARIQIHLSKRQEEQFLTYFRFLIEKNKVMNLTTITDYEEVVWKHFIDSALIGYVWEFELTSRTYSLIDVGTGAGFPGIPLKILYPNLQVLLLDSLNKRILFLNELIRDLGLEDISAVHARAEDAAHNSIYREQFDLCVSRAVANLSSLSEYCLPFVRRGGYFISYKSGEIDQEATNAKRAIQLLGGSVTDIEKSEIPGTDLSRSFVIIRKEKNTSKKYPRKAGIPGKTPL